MSETKLPDANEIKPGWSNGIIELLDPVELGWRLVAQEVKLGLLPEAA